jgi:hypothetical protein
VNGAGAVAGVNLVSSIRSFLKGFERRWLRRPGRGIRGQLRRLLGESDRIDHLENRIASLEALVRELTGLAYLRLDGQPTDARIDAEVTAPCGPPREAA